MPNRLALAVAVITLNEVENLPRCLESVRDLAAEIVVIDSGSTDRTRDVAVSSELAPPCCNFLRTASRESGSSSWSGKQAVPLGAGCAAETKGDCKTIC